MVATAQCYFIRKRYFNRSPPKGKFGFINKEGKEVTSLKYDYAWSFSEGLAAVKLNDKFGFINKAGKEVIPLKYDHAYRFENGNAKVILNGKEFYINTKGERVEE